MRTLNDWLERTELIYSLSVHDAHGKQWLPVFGYGDEVEVYMPARIALAIHHTDLWRLLECLKQQLEPR